MPNRKHDDGPDNGGNKTRTLVRAIPVYGSAKKGGHDTSYDAENGREDKSLRIVG